MLIWIAMLYMSKNIHLCTYIRECVYLHVRVDMQVYVCLYLTIFVYELTIMCIYCRMHGVMCAHIHPCDWNMYTYYIFVCR